MKALAWLGSVAVLYLLLRTLYRIAFTGAFLLLVSPVLAAGPRIDEPQDVVGVLEVNHVVDFNGVDRFTQLIYREGNGLIRDWRYLQSHSMLPDSDWAVWNDEGKWRMLFVRRAIETWTRFDPEREEAQWRPVEERRTVLH